MKKKKNCYIINLPNTAAGGMDGISIYNLKKNKYIVVW